MKFIHTDHSSQVDSTALLVKEHRKILRNFLIKFGK